MVRIPPEELVYRLSNRIEDLEQENRDLRAEVDYWKEKFNSVEVDTPNLIGMIITDGK